MRSEALDITLESRGNTTWLFLSGPFHNEQAPGFKEKVSGLIEDGGRKIIIDLENVTDMDDTVSAMFLALLNLVKGKGGDIYFIFKNLVVTQAFSPYAGIFSIYPDAQSLPSGGFFGALKKRSRLLSRKTGIRLSRPIAITFLVTLSGWILTLVFIIHLQNQRIREQEIEMRSLHEWQRNANAELKILHDKMRPLEQLGVVKDTVGKQFP